MTLFIRAITLLSFCMLFGTRMYAQSFSSLGRDFDDRSFRMMIRGTYVKPFNDGVYGGWTINGGLCMNSANKWGIRARYENPTLGDAIWMLAYLLRKKESPQTESGLEHAHGSGFFGWMQLYKNVVARDRFLLAPGISIADYIIGNEQDIPGIGIRSYDPAGYHFAAGGGIMATYLATPSIWVDTYINYDIAFAKVEYSHPGYIPAEGYPKPHFLTYGVEINHRSGLWLGARINQLIDRGDTNAKSVRTDISIGYHFKDREK